jgi:hypothetical protein
MKRLSLGVLYLLAWNAPMCYLFAQMWTYRASGSVARDFESLQATERFFADWLALNCLAALTAMTFLCISPRLRHLIRGTDKPFEKETSISVFGSMVAALVGYAIYRQFSI